MNATVVLDASAVLAFLQGEPGADKVGDALKNSHCVVASANQTEIISKALDRGLDRPTIEAALTDLNYEVVDCTAQDGVQAGWMRTATRALGLSLGDRLCLATARRIQAQVLTADRPWTDAAKALKLRIHCIRPGKH